MASSAVLKKPFTSPSSSRKLLNRALHSARPFTATAHVFGPKAAASVVADFDEEDDILASNVDPRYSGRIPYIRCVISPFSDVFSAPISPRGRSLGHAMEEMVLSSGKSAGSGAPNYSATEKPDGLHLRFEMPGLGKEDVQVTVEENTLVINGGGANKKEESAGSSDGADDDGGMALHVKMELSRELYKLKEIKAEMKNGVLKVLVPKVKDEEREVFHVTVD